MAQSIFENEDKINFIVRKHGYPIVSWEVDQFMSRYYTTFDEDDRFAIMMKMKDGSLKQLSEVSEIVAGLTKPKYNNLLIFPSACRKDITNLVKEYPK